MDSDVCTVAKFCANLLLRFFGLRSRTVSVVCVCSALRSGQVSRRRQCEGRICAPGLLRLTIDEPQLNNEQQVLLNELLRVLEPTLIAYMDACEAREEPALGNHLSGKAQSIIGEFRRCLALGQRVQHSNSKM